MKLETAYSIGNYLPNMKAIEDYVADRLQDIYKLMSKEDDVDQIRKYQGAVFELNKLLSIRDTALKVVEQERLNGRRKKGNPKSS